MAYDSVSSTYAGSESPMAERAWAILIILEEQESGRSGRQSTRLATSVLKGVSLAQRSDQRT
jgi:hypothetical protein